MSDRPSPLSLLVQASEPDTSPSTVYDGPPIGFSAKVVSHLSSQTTMIGNMLAPRPKVLLKCKGADCEKCFEDDESEIDPLDCSFPFSASLYGTMSLVMNTGSEEDAWVAARKAWERVEEVESMHGGKLDEGIELVCPRRSPPVVKVEILEKWGL